MTPMPAPWVSPEDPNDGQRAGDDPVPSHGFRSSALLDVRGLRFTLTEGTRPDEGISLSVGHGEALGLVGDAGSGRSELALAIAGRRSPSVVIHSGSILFDGREQVGSPRPWLARTHGPRLGSVSPRDAPGVVAGRRGDRALIRRLATAFTLPPWARTDPELLVFDDPTAGREPEDRAAVVALLGLLRQGRAVIIGSTDFSVVASTCDRVAVLDAGRIVEQGSTAEIMAAPRHPSTRALLGLT